MIRTYGPFAVMTAGAAWVGTMLGRWLLGPFREQGRRF